MKNLVLALHGPLQSWGTASKLDERDTGAEPSLSALLGLLGAAEGRSRHLAAPDARDVQVTVRCDRPGRRMRDFHTISASPPLVRTGSGTLRTSTVLSERWYLADAAFLVVITFPDPDRASHVFQALRSPRWALSLGRRSCPPTFPFALAVLPGDPLDVVASAPALCRDRAKLSVSVEASRRDKLTARGWPPAELSHTSALPVGERTFEPVLRCRAVIGDPFEPSSPLALAQWAHERCQR